MRSAFNFLASSFTSFKIIFFSFSQEIKKEENVLIPKEYCIELKIVLQCIQAPAALNISNIIPSELLLMGSYSTSILVVSLFPSQGIQKITFQIKNIVNKGC